MMGSIFERTPIQMLREHLSYLEEFAQREVSRLAELEVEVAECRERHRRSVEAAKGYRAVLRDLEGSADLGEARAAVLQASKTKGGDAE